MDRRKFFKIMGLASTAAITACKANDADKKLLPYIVPPGDDIIPGIPHYIRSTCTECPANCGLNIKIRDNKPVKLEGSPNHPINNGTLCMRGQASLARLYSPNRIKQPMIKDKNGILQPATWETTIETIKKALKEEKSKGKENIFLSSQTSSGFLDAIIVAFCEINGVKRLDEIELFPHNSIKLANQTLFNQYCIPYYKMNNTDTLITLGADIVETFLSPVEWTQTISNLKKDKNKIWFHIEPIISLTGISSTNHSRIKPGTEPFLLAYILRHITPRNPIPQQTLDQIPNNTIEKTSEITGIPAESIRNITEKLNKASHPLILSGGPAVHNPNGFVTALYTGLIQWTLAMPGKTIDFDQPFNTKNVGTIDTLLNLEKESNANHIGVAFLSQLHIVNTMPHLLSSFQKASLKVALSEISTPLTDACDIILPLSDPLESWGEKTPRKDILCLIQPAIPPLHSTRTEDEILTAFNGDNDYRTSYIFKGLDDKKISIDGFITGYSSIVEKINDKTPQISGPIELNNNITLPIPVILNKKEWLIITPSIRTFDGRSSDITLLSEIPHPLSTVSYGKFISISPQTARDQNIEPGNIIEIRHNGSTAKFPVLIDPGLTPGITALTIDAAQDLKLEIDPVTREFIYAIPDVKPVKTSETFRLPVLSGGKNTHGRGSFWGIAGPDEHEPHGKEEHNHSHEHKRYTLYPPHEHKNYRWGMVIDLDACTGCSACVAACYIENNIPMVGVDEHLRGREMAWMRIEPYYDDPENPQLLPMMCQQCDCAPCENVCPVFATYHNPEGLNAQVYNRCVGTRYCANNCPYKARRFNWFDHDKDQPLHLATNPDISVRSKGIMEKCTFCSQRIRFAKDQAKDENRLVRDGEVVTACAQTCPANAITFGSLMDPNSKVSQLARTQGAYRVLEQLGTEPAVFYIRRNREDKKTENKKG